LQIIHILSKFNNFRNNNNVLFLCFSVRKENEVALQWAEMRMVRWMCDVKVKDRVPSRVERLGLNDIISVLQQNRLRWYGHVLQKEDNDLTRVVPVKGP